MHYAIGSITLNKKVIFFAKLPFGGEMTAETPEQFWQIIREIEKQYREHHEGKQIELTEPASLILKFTATIAEGVWRALRTRKYRPPEREGRRPHVWR
jgi:hypothetical protein